jgi:predicted Na+-dependent transporter
MADDADRSAKAGRRLCRSIRILTVLNAVLLVAALLLPLVRTSVGTATDLWHDCVIDPVTGSGSDGWSWPVLLTLVPFAIGVLVGAWGRGAFADDSTAHTEAARGSLTLLVVSVLGAGWITLLWLVPTSHCVS